MERPVPVSLASPLDLRWAGVFSYIAFRLLHTFRDRQTGRLPAGLSLSEYVVYIIFFRRSRAGPIDRIERFRRRFTSTSFPNQRGLW